MVTLLTDIGQLYQAVFKKVFREDTSTTVLGNGFHVSQIRLEKNTYDRSKQASIFIYSINKQRYNIDE